MEINNFYGHSPPFKLAKDRVFSQHFGNMTRPLELGIFASFYTKLGKNTPYNKNKKLSDSWAKSSHILQQ